ncbi:methyl-accepting chemotaxis protein [Psychrobacillus antarcticus]|uniref:methyl-accepting chemotaxis protein n=1 Tax=Psychrobacillus antarcticus TaxID=2879115 RepID=UPI00240835B6|nr:methyl-accepting chemotaxis protein [Psychrobacillus antarcticus]
MKLKGKLISTYLIVTAFIFVVAGVSLLALGTVNQNSKEMYHNRVIPLTVVIELESLTENTRGQILSAVLIENPEKTQTVKSNMEKVTVLIQKYRELVLDENEGKAITKFEADWNAFKSTNQSIIDLINVGDYTGALAGIRASDEVFADSQESLLVLKDGNISRAEELNNSNKLAFETNRIIVFFIALFALVVAVVIGIIMGNSIGNPTRNVSERLVVIASGDLTKSPLITKRKDEIGVLVHATNEMQRDLQNVISEIHLASDALSSQSEELSQSAEQVKVGSEQIAITMQELANGAETQATSATDISEMMGVFAQAIQDSDESSRGIVDDSHQVTLGAEEGQQLMERSVNKMKDIDGIVKDSVEKVKGLDNKTNEISTLVEVIQSIANQTNLLALNAAIEAARAGEQGKGFAVVADEVRKLAEQVSHSVGEITDIVVSIQAESQSVVTILENGYKEVTEGTGQIQRTGEKFQEITNGIHAMTEKVEQISQNLVKVSLNSQKINASVQEIASVSEESAAGVEETAASAEESVGSMEEVVASSQYLATIATQLAETVAKFKTTGSHE